MKVQRARDFILSKLEKGYYTFPLREAEGAVGAGRNTWEAINRLVKQGWLFSPGKGFYVIIDPQHQGSGFLPVEWFIDDWMKHLGVRYYLGILSAAMLHGAAHQKPQKVQVVSDKVIADVDKGAYRISFFYKKNIPESCCGQMQSPAGYYRVSTPETTAYDILRYPNACPSLDLAATVLQELGERISADGLAALVDSGAEAAVLQRLGWLLDYTGWSEKTGLLADRLRDRQMTYRLIRTDLPKDGSRDPKWRVVVNARIEADL